MSPETELAPPDALRWVLHRYELSDEPRRTWWRFWLAVTSQAQSDPEVAQRLSQQHRSIVDRWRTCLERGMAGGQLHPGLDAAAEAARLTAYAHKLATSHLIDPSSVNWPRRS